MKILIERWEQVSKKLSELGAEIPADKLEWRPLEGMRTCGGVLRHAAFWNEYLAASLKGLPVDDTANGLSATEFATKKRVIEALQSSSEKVATALRGIGENMDAKCVEQVTPFLEHNSEHYGQLAVYARLLGVVPPASRG